MINSHLRSYSHLSSDLVNRIADLKKRPLFVHSESERQESVETKCREIEQLFSDCHSVLEQIELEIREVGDSGEKNRQTMRLRGFQDNMNQLSKDFEEAKLAAKRPSGRATNSNTHFHSEERQRLISSDYDEEQNQMMRTTERLERSSHQLKEGHRIALETEQIGHAVLDDLSTQRETLTSARARLLETEKELSRSRILANSMLRRAIQNKVLLVAIPVFILIVISLCIYLVSTKNS